MPSNPREFAIQLAGLRAHDILPLVVARDTDLIRAAKEEMRQRAAAVCGAHTHANLILALPLDPPEPDAGKEKRE